MRVVFDTNVLVSGIFFGGVPDQLLLAAHRRALTLVVSAAILDEYRRVGRELSIRYPGLDAPFEAALAAIAMQAANVHVPPLDGRVSEDPAGDMFLAACVASNTPVVVSGDKDLLRVSGWRGIVVLTPRRFHDHYLGAQ